MYETTVTLLGRVATTVTPVTFNDGGLKASFRRVEVVEVESIWCVIGGLGWCSVDLWGWIEVCDVQICEGMWIDRL